MNKREWVLKAFNNEEVEHAPMGFWFHFLEDEVNADVFETPEKLEISLQGHKKYITESKPDFIKIMCDGFFQYPLQGGKARVDGIEDLALIQPLESSHPWVQRQAEFACKVADFDRDLVALYSTFSPSSFLRYKLLHGPLTVLDLLRQDAEAVVAALDRMSDGIIVMIHEMVAASGVDGIYFSVSSPDPGRLSDEEYRRYISPSEKKVLEAANSVASNSVMHICGWGGQRNNLQLFSDYKPKVFNWATHVEHVDLSQGKQMLGGTSAVLGGFPSETGSFLYKNGTKEEIQAFARKLVKDNGKKGILVGADCTMPMDLPWERLQWVREALQGV